LLSAPEASFVRPTADTQVEVVVVRIAARRLVQNPGRSKHCLWRPFVARCVPQKARLELVGAEEPLHARLLVHDQGAHEVPVACFVETEDAVAQHRQAEAVELQPTVAMGGHASGVPHVEQQVGVAPRAVSAVPRMCASAWVR